jgi:hypothetical protein
MEKSNQNFEVRFEFCCPYCEESVTIQMKLEIENSMLIFDCPCCLGSLGVLIDELENSGLKFSLRNNCFIAADQVYVFQFEDVIETAFGFMPSLNLATQPFVPGHRLKSDFGNNDGLCPN